MMKKKVLEEKTKDTNLVANFNIFHLGKCE